MARGGGRLRATIQPLLRSRGLSPPATRRRSDSSGRRVYVGAVVIVASVVALAVAASAPTARATAVLGSATTRRWRSGGAARS